MKKVALHNLGCKVNAYETEAMQEILEQNGYEIVPFEEKADLQCHEYGRQEITPDASSCKKDESGGSGDCCRMLCAVSGGGTPERYFCGYSHWK